MAGDTTPAGPPLALPFPGPGPEIARAYHTLWLAENGTKEEMARIGSPANLPHPWDPPTCTDRSMRWELWLWLDAVATWLNHEYLWEPGATPAIPDCWPQHPHIVHKLAVVADMRYRCRLTGNSDALEIWHRVVLPGFLDRMKQRLKNHCDDGHQPWPARSRYTRHTSDGVVNDRDQAFHADIALLPPAPAEQHPSSDPAPTLRLVRDADGNDIRVATGEVLT